MKIVLKKNFRTISGAIFACIVLLFLALPLFIPPHFIKEQIIEQVQLAAGRKIKIDGKFSVHFLPLPGVQIEQVTLFSPKTWGDDPFAQVQTLKIRLELWPLLHGHIVINKMDMENPVIHLKVNTQSRDNWTFVPRAYDIENKQVLIKRAESKKVAGQSALFSLTSLTIKHGVLTYQNDIDKTQWHIENLELTATDSSFGQDLTLNGSAALGGTPINLSANIASMPALVSGSMSGFSASLKSDLLNADVNGSVNTYVFSGKASVISPSLKAFFNQLSPGTISTPAALALNAQGNMECGPEECNLLGANINLDNVKFVGDIKSHFKAIIPQINFNVATNFLDLNHFFPIEQKKIPSLPNDENNIAPPQDWSAEPIVLPLFSGVQLGGTIRNNGIMYRRFKVDHSLLHFNLTPHVLNIAMLNAELYGGKGTIIVSANDDNPATTIDCNINLSDVDSGRLLYDLSNKNIVGGKGILKITMQGQGKSEKDIMSNLEGAGGFKLANGAIYGFNIANAAAITQSSQADSKQATVFSGMEATFKISNGIISNDDLVVVAPSTNMTGKGSINLPMQTIDYRITPRSVSGGNAKAETSKPVMITGSLSNPIIGTNISGSTKNVAHKSPLKEKSKNALETKAVGN